MWCKRVRSQLSAYADGELSLAEAKTVEEHLSHCEQCALEHSSLQQLVRITSSIPAEEVPSGLHTAILTRLAYAEHAPVGRERSRRPGTGLLAFNPWMWTALSGAAAALVMGLVQKPQRVHSTVPANTARKVRPVPRVTPPHSREREVASAESARRPGHRPAQSGLGRDGSLPNAAKTDPAHPARLATVPRQVSLPKRRVADVQVTRKALSPKEEVPVTPQAAPGKPAAEAPVAPSPVPVATPSTLMAMPGEPMVNSVTAPPAPEMLSMGMEKEPSTRMAGAPGEAEAPQDEDDGVRALRLFLEERNRSVPQPPPVGPAGPRPRKL